MTQNTKGTLEQVARIFAEETVAQRDRSKVALENDVAVEMHDKLHEEYTSRLEERMREIGWTLEEYQHYAPAEERDTFVMQFVLELLPQAREYITSVPSNAIQCENGQYVTSVRGDPIT